MEGETRDTRSSPPDSKEIIIIFYKIRSMIQICDSEEQEWLRSLEVS